MSYQRRIHQAPRIMRLLGWCFIIAGAFVTGLSLASPFSSAPTGIGQDLFGICLGVLLVGVGGITAIDDSAKIDLQGKEIVFYERFLRKKEVGRIVIKGIRSIDVERYHNPSSKGGRYLYRVVIDGYCVKDSLTEKAAERFQSKLMRVLSEV